MSQKIMPLAAIPATGPDGVATASKATLGVGELLFISGRISAGTVSLRPYFWEPETTSTTGIGGAWIPLGGDAVAGNNPISFDSAQYGGAANGSYTIRRAQVIFVLVKENNVGAVVDFVHISSELSTVGQ